MGKIIALALFLGLGCDPDASAFTAADAGADALVCDPDAATDLHKCVCYCLAKYPSASLARCEQMCPDAGP
jgi:hypothetical protein